MNDGVRAVSQGLKDGGAQVVYNFPGFYSHDIAAALGDSRIALNERVAFAEGFGASLAGKRTVVTFKNVGLNVASDAFLHAVIAGVRAGLVLVVTDDIAVWGSQESQDSRHYFDFYGGLWLEPKDLQQAYDFSRDAFELSEKLDVPAVIRLANSFFELEGTIETKERKVLTKQLAEVEASKFVVHPYFYKQQEASLHKKNQLINAWAESAAIAPEARNKHGVIVVGAMKNTEMAKDADVLHVTTLPLPRETISSFVQGHETIAVLEDGDEYVANKIRVLVSNLQITSHIPDQRGSAVAFTKWKRYPKLFKALAEVKGTSLVVGEIAQFTVETYDTVGAALSLGTAASTAIGHAENSSSFTFCLSGDCSLLHEGIGILDEAVSRKVKLGLIVFDNHASWCTGGQTPAGNIERIAQTGINKLYLDYEAANHDEVVGVLNKMCQFDGVSVLYLKVPLGKLARDEE